MRWLWILATVAGTTIALVAVLALIGVPLVGRAFAGGPWLGSRGFGGWGAGHGYDVAASLPPPLAGLKDLPVAERFSHFTAAQVALTDRDGNPVTVHVTPGTVTAASESSVEITANDGSSRAFTLTDQTIVHGNRAANGEGTAQRQLSANDQVVVVTIDNAPNAIAVMTVSPEGFGGGRPWGRFGR